MIALLVAVLGLAVGSFLNVVIARLRSGETGWRNRSQCPECHIVLKPVELIPIVSYFALRGRCRACKKAISWQYPLVEGSTLALFLVAYCLAGGAAGLAEAPFHLLRDWLFICGLTVIFVIDLRDMVVFDAVTLPMAVIAFVLNVLLGAKPLNLLLAAAVGAGFFLLQYALSKGKWIGGGDIRIGAMMGMMLGFPAVIMALFAAYMLGALYALGLMTAGRAKWSGQIAFGTFLSVTTLLTLFFGQAAMTWYASLLGF